MESNANLTGFLVNHYLKKYQMELFLTPTPKELLSVQNILLLS